MVAGAIVDAYDEYEQLAALHAVIEVRLALPFDTATHCGAIVALCGRGRHRQAIGLLHLPLPEPAPEGWAWVEAYRHWGS